MTDRVQPGGSGSRPAADSDEQKRAADGEDMQRSHQNYGFEETGSVPEEEDAAEKADDVQKRPGSFGKVATRGGHGGEGWTLQRGKREERGEQDQEQASYGQGGFSRDGQGEFGTNDFGEPGFGQEEYRRGFAGQGGYTDRSQQPGDFSASQPNDKGTPPPT